MVSAEGLVCGKYKGEMSQIELTLIMINKSSEILEEPPKPNQEAWEQNFR